MGLHVPREAYSVYSVIKEVYKEILLANVMITALSIEWVFNINYFISSSEDLDQGCCHFIL